MSAEVTKKALAESLKNLSRSKPIHKISVNSICDSCGVNRNSFYYHFKDKYDLMNWIFYREFLKDRFYKKPTEGWDFLLDLSRYFGENREFYVAAMETSGQNAFTGYMEECLRPVMRRFLYRRIGPCKEWRFYCRSYTDAFRSAVFYWLQSGEGTAEDFITRFRKMCEVTAQVVLGAGE